MTSVGADFIRIGGKMKKLLLTGIAALFLATGAAHAREIGDAHCRRNTVIVTFTKEPEEEIELHATGLKRGDKLQYRGGRYVKLNGKACHARRRANPGEL